MAAGAAFPGPSFDPSRAHAPRAQEFFRDQAPARGGFPTDRLPPGKGVVKWREMLGLLAEKNYTGYLSYEAPNPELWARSPYDVAREGVELTRQLLRDAVPSYAGA